MPTYKAPLDDMFFILNDVLDVDQLSKLPGLEHIDKDEMTGLLEKFAKFSEEVLHPLNKKGDEQGLKFDKGKGTVTTPAGFKEAYAQYVKDGWARAMADKKYGGMGLPMTFTLVLNEMMSSANLSFGMYPGLSHGAYSALDKHGSEELKKQFLPHMAKGNWTGTMCLTEPHAGTDLGLIKTKAEEQSDGSYKITGKKVFISAGEHDMSDNILHLVLAKIDSPDTPEGVKGISLFIVPKHLPDENNEPGARNEAKCAMLMDQKMGLKANATCALSFDGAKGWLVGEPHKGLRAMFTMMNEARLGVGIQGLGIAEVAYQNAVDYAKKRLQGRKLAGAAEPDKPADPIIVHPDVRQNLMAIKAMTEGQRALAYEVAMMEDIARSHPDAKTRKDAEDHVALLTPIIKSSLTDNGTFAANVSMQVHGGSGYLKTRGIEQYVRDVRVTQIYEGTNGVQALDLVGRKALRNRAALSRKFFKKLKADIKAANKVPGMREFTGPLSKALWKLQISTLRMAYKGWRNPDEAAAAATDYLNMFALVSTGRMWMKMAQTAQEKLPEARTKGNERFYETKLKTGRYYMQKLLPQVATLHTRIANGAKSVMALDADDFDHTQSGKIGRNIIKPNSQPPRPRL